MEAEHVEDVETEGLSEPQREPLYFRYDASKVSPEMAEIMESIKLLAESMLYHWKTFPIVLPKLRSNVQAADGNPGIEESRIGLKDLFIAPSFDELEEVAKNRTGDLKKLNEKQLASIWNRGEFEVDSIHFPGQVHKWRLSELFQKGTLRSHETLLRDAALSLRLLIITARNRFSSQFFSITQSVRAWGKGLWKLLDVFIGMPSTTPGDLCTKVREEHMGYLVAELNIKPSSKKELYEFCEYIKEQSKILKIETHKSFDLKPPPITHRFLSPKGQEIDLRLFNQDLMNNCLPILSNILDREAKGWTVSFRQRLIKEYKGKGLSIEEITEMVNEAVMQEYLVRVFTSISSNAELNSLQQGLGELLVSQAKSVIAMQKAVQNLQQKMQKYKEQLVGHLRKEYPVKSRIKAWMNEQVETFKDDFITQNLWSAHEEAISICEEQGLHQAVYFLRRDLNFIKERDAVLHQELSKVKKPTRTFSFSTRIWLPGNWVIRRQSHGEIEVIETVIRDGSPPIDGGMRNVTYSVSKYTECKTTTRHPFWRWWNYFHRTWAWTWNSMFLFGVIIPWCSKFSLRALFSVKPFMPDLKLSQVDGALYPRESSLTPTMISNLQALWENVRKSRKEFEETPDTGFLGKSLTRHFNRFWNFVVKGAIGSLLLAIAFPLLCVCVSTGSIILSITSPLWVPTATLLAHIAFFLFYDVDCPDENENKFSILLEAVVWHISIQGCFQPVTAFLFGALCCPVASMFIMLFGVLRRAGRGLWDSFMFHAIIKSRGRIPASDGFVARRIAGPGLASNYFYQIRPEQTLAALEASIELDELDAWKHSVLRVIEQPKEEFRKFAEQCFKPFSADLVEDGVYRRLVTETSLYRTDLVTKATERERLLYTGLYNELQRRIRLSERDLKLCILLSSKLLEKFYPKHVLSRLQDQTEEEFWEKNQLEFRDWNGFACKKLADIFSKGFLTPLEDTDVTFELKVEHLNLSRYIGMLASAEFYDDLDVVTEVQTPSSEIAVKTPSLDTGYFNPNQKFVHSTHLGTPRERLCPWKTSYEHRVFDKLEIPLPIPHPTTIAVSIYNRENDQEPINLDDVFCQRIIRAAKEVPCIDLGELSSVDLYDAEPSTPDNATSESITVPSHLALQERSFSEEGMNKPGFCGTPISDAASLPLESPSHNPGEVTTVLLEKGSNSLELTADPEEGKICYSEPEKDNSCVVFMDEVKEEGELTV